MRYLLFGSLMCLTVALEPAPVARACGGFFCGQQPVDQQAERIVFAVGPAATTMIVQIAFQGRSSDFAWVLPLADVPEDIGTFPARAITALDVNTSPMFWRPDDPECSDLLLNGGGSDENTPGVTVHIETTVGPYDVAVIEGTDPSLLVEWLRDAGYRITDSMVPMVATYTAEGMKLLALKLTPNADTSDIEPVRLELPPGAPSIPIRLTAIAAEPEMGLLVFILGAQRWGPANWSEIEIDPATLRYSSHAWPAETDYLARVAREGDAVGGQGWITEMAGPTAPLLESVRAATPRDDEDARTRDELLALLGPHPYLTRLYARLSPDEMTLDPIFRLHGGDDVSRDVYLSRYVDGEDMCAGSGLRPCDFASCGAGTCAQVDVAGSWQSLAGCACPAATTARTTLDPRSQPMVSCISRASSVLNPGDRNSPAGSPLPDPCVGYDCGEGGTCFAHNMTPTCECSGASVAVGWFTPGGDRRTRCIDPAFELPPEWFEEDVVPDPPPEMPSPAALPPPTPPVLVVGGGGGCAAAGAGSEETGGAALLAGVVAGLFLRRRRR